MKNVKEVQFWAKFNGHGIVQTDSNGQKGMLFGKDGYKGLSGDVKNQGGFSKKNFYGNDFKIKLTPDCLKKNIRGGVARMTGQVDKMGPKISAFTMAEPYNLLFGWLVTRKKENDSSDESSDKSSDLNKNGSFGLKKNGSVMMSAIEQTNTAKPFMEVCTSTDMIKQGDTSFRFAEKVGDMEYEMKYGSINLKELQFIPMDEIADRQAVDEPIGFELLNVLGQKLPDYGNKIDHYINTDNSLKEYIAERGIKLTNEQVNYLVQYFLKGLYNFAINKRESFIKLTELYVCLVENPLDEKDWKKIESIKDIEDIVFEMMEYYTEIPENERETYEHYRGKFTELTDNMQSKQKKAKENRNEQKAIRAAKKLAEVENV